MKILVFLNQLIIGGAEVNGIELSSMLKDIHGQDIVLFATPGPMVEIARTRQLRYVPAPFPVGGHPSPKRMRALRDLVRRERPDIILAWDYRACLDAFYGVHLPMRVPMQMVLTHMDVDRLLPKSIPAAFMTPLLVEKAREAGRRHVRLLLPPVDINRNAPSVIDPTDFRTRYGLGSDELTIVTVSRLSSWLKGESLQRTIEAVGNLGAELPLRLILIGDGDARSTLEKSATKVNARLGRDAVLFTGAMLDPRPAYAAADIVVGMGGSSLRGLAFAKPVIVVGERGFAAPFTPETADIFYHGGMYGIGDGSTENYQLEASILELAHLSDRELAARREFSRQFVVRRYSLESVSSGLNESCCRALENQASLRQAVGDAVRTPAVMVAGRMFPRDVRARIASFISH